MTDMTDVLQAMDEWGPEKVVCVSDHRSGMRGVLVIDNTARGMGKGGTRMSAALTVAEVARLARTMTWKWAAVDLFYGGAKAGLLGDPKGSRKEAQLRAFARALANEVPKEYVFGLDMGMSEVDASILADELGDRGASVGLPAELGGFPYDQLGVTGFGVAEAAHAAFEHSGSSIEGATVLVQGFGAVGAAAAQRLCAMGAVVVGVSTQSGAVHDAEGIDIDSLVRARVDLGDDCIRTVGPATDPKTLMDQRADLLVPAAQQDLIGNNEAAGLAVRFVVEGANMPTSDSAQAVLRQRGIVVIPDFIANAGGVVAAAHSMITRNSPFVPDGEGILEMISTKLRANTAAVLERSLVTDVSTHQAARSLAQDRVRSAMSLRGRLTDL